MAKYKLILCPIDFSDISDNAFLTALDIAEQFKADLLVVHVYHLPTSSYPEGIYSVPAVEEEARVKDQLSKKLEEYIRKNTTSDVNITTGLYEGIPHIEITRSAEKNNADMIVMGTHGRTGLTHVLLGSVAERVIHTSHIPVLTVRK